MTETTRPFVPSDTHFAFVMGSKGKIPITPRPLWGFMPTAKGLVGVTTFQERVARASIGEFAIELLGKLGVGEETLAWLHEEKDPMATLNRIQKGEISAVGPWGVVTAVETAAVSDEDAPVAVPIEAPVEAPAETAAPIGPDVPETPCCVLGGSCTPCPNHPDHTEAP